MNRLLLYILYLRNCNKRIRDKVTFHVAIMRDKGPKNYAIDEEALSKMECGNPMGALKDLIVDTTMKQRVSFYKNHIIKNNAYKNILRLILFSLISYKLNVIFSIHSIRGRTNCHIHKICFETLLVKIAKPNIFFLLMLILSRVKAWLRIWMRFLVSISTTTITI